MIKDINIIAIKDYLLSPHNIKEIEAQGNMNIKEKNIEGGEVIQKRKNIEEKEVIHQENIKENIEVIQIDKEEKVEIHRKEEGKAENIEEAKVKKMMM